MKVEDIQLAQSFKVLKKSAGHRAWKMPSSKVAWKEAPDWVKKLAQDGLIEPEMNDDNHTVFTIMARKSRHGKEFGVYYPGDILIEGELLPVRKHEIELFYELLGGESDVDIAN